MDCVEWGISTVEIDNLRRLTPEVVRTEKDQWHIEYDFHFPVNEANQANFNHCLDIVIDFLRRKQDFQSRIRTPRREVFQQTPTVYIGKQLHAEPSTASQVVLTVEDNWFYRVEKIVSGFDPSEKYLNVHFYQTDKEGKEINHVWGYLLEETT